MQKGGLLYVLILFVGLTFVGRLFYLQILDNPYKTSQLNNASIKSVYDYPERGYIYDRNGKLLVANQQSYDVMIIPNEVKPLDTIEFCNLLKIDKENFLKQYHRAKIYSPRLPSVFLGHVSKEDYAYLQEKLFKYKGFYIQKRSIRNYPLKSAANVLGYISEVNENHIEKNGYYQQGELIGFHGVEKTYENTLRGIKGVKRIQKDRFNKEIGPFKNGIYDSLAIPGKDLTLSLDAVLQQYGEKLMTNKRGGIVAIEPSSGEILSLVTAPSYDPNLMVGRIRSKNSVRLFGDTINKPMYDRGLKGAYPPGSPFKILTGLVGLQEGVIDETTAFTCHHGYRYGKNGFMGCHAHASRVQLNFGIYTSCNAYFANTYRLLMDKYDTPREGMNNWNKHIESFGLGNFLGYDLPIGQKGLIPDADYYDRWYPAKNWTSTYTLSNAIGQGEVLTSPIQLANMTAAIANRGFYYTPHIVKEIQGDTIDSKFKTRHYTTIDKEYFEPIIQGLFDVFENPKGTAHSSRVKGIEICGKTGTAENYSVINGKRVKLTDHSIFIAFAPKDNPKIALAVFVENGYWGSRWAGPIATLMIEKYLNGETSRKYLEDRMFNGSLQDEYDKQLNELLYIAEGEK
ncbi:penicillin-binding protein 2 [Urechidicola croceus]|uniref:Penicillin-binding protein 2 n=1 Tax=Urechidicola croceus TaxID=1850246 RepID=A0A1D8PAT1_9FLAO|nr:penicillin-binding protein 2 [Urechidicola croceus]AOW21655.1 penicillin-binding protein 2 [Urechidicola croceus]